MRTIVIAMAAMLCGAPLSAQWLSEPTRGVPRLPDGRPNLSAPAPRTPDGKPDFSGLWLTPLHPGYVGNIAADLDPADVQPAAARIFDERMGDFGKDDPSTIGCLPFGPRHITGGGLLGRAKIVQTPALIVVLHEDLAYRQIFMDGRQLEPDPHPSFMGYSVGRWEGDVLVVESFGFNDRTWLDFGGHPHSPSLRITERYRRPDFGHVRREITVSDPQTFSKPIRIEAEMVFSADTELAEYVCAETPRDRFELTGRTAVEHAIEVAPELLARYAGVYDIADANAFGVRTLTVSVLNGRLVVDFNGKGRMPMVPLSQTVFTPRMLGTYEFVADARGVVTHILVSGVEGTVRAVRRR
jgi:hypothetical protein